MPSEPRTTSLDGTTPRFVIPPPPRPSLPVRATAARFPVHRIFCVGRNYAEHAIEMGHDPDREPPFFFLKGADCLLSDGKALPYPDATQNLHHEIELVVALATGGRDISQAEALTHVFGYAVGLDMTRRDLQAQAKKLGRPWEVGKAFDHAAPCGEITPVTQCGHPANGAIWLQVNGDLRQSGDLAQMIWKLPEVIAYLSGLFTLFPGDLIMTGTPAGVAAVERGDTLLGGIDGLGQLRVEVV